MGFTKIDALRISPAFTSEDWRNLDQDEIGDWPKAARILKDRLDGRFLRYAGNCLRSPHSGFVVLSIHSLLLETMQQFRKGVFNGRGMSKLMITGFLEGDRFQPEFDKNAREAYYADIRCGLLHQAEAKKLWLVRRDQPFLLQPFPHGDGYIIDVRHFHRRIRLSLNDYLRDLTRGENENLRQNLWRKMDHICNVREQRGAIEAGAIND
jgi:hypothetical protein